MACGKEVDASAASPLSTADSVPPAAQGQYSPDGKWWWNGVQWVSVPEKVAATPTPAPASPAVASAVRVAHVIGGGGKKRKRKSAVQTLATLAVTFAVIAALCFVATPNVAAGAFVGTLSFAAAGVTTLILLALLVVRFIRGQRRPSWLVLMAALLALEAVLVGGVDAYAASQVAPVTSVLQDYYADVADAVSVGNAISAGQAPADATFAEVYANAEAIWEGTFSTNLGVPGQLLSYGNSIHAWANVVAEAAFAG